MSVFVVHCAVKLDDMHMCIERVSNTGISCRCILQILNNNLTVSHNYWQVTIVLYLF